MFTDSNNTIYKILALAPWGIIIPSYCAIRYCLLHLPTSCVCVYDFLLFIIILITGVSNFFIFFSLVIFILYSCHFTAPSHTDPLRYPLAAIKVQFPHCVPNKSLTPLLLSPDCLQSYFNKDMMYCLLHLGRVSIYSPRSAVRSDLK